jgi:cell division protein FtsL
MRLRYLALWVVAVVATGAAFVSYLALRFETVRLGYELDDATREHKRLSELKRLVALEAQTLRERQRVHAIAERSLGMAAPDLAQVVVVEARAAAGRERNVAGAGRAHSAGRAVPWVR